MPHSTTTLDTATLTATSPLTPSVTDLGVLRFITAGSVDDGKSTLIGRMLVDTQAVLVDQIEALQRSHASGSHNRAGNTAIDLSRLTDGLEDERAQGITIDVAYRYFATAERKFIIGDAPGHEQYTRNMVTAASTADCAVILIDATRVHNGELLTQTRRHSKIAQLLGIRSIIVAVNKMDLLDWSQPTYDTILQSYGELAQRIGLTDWQAVPVSALNGDNVVHRSEAAPWYQGPSLLELLHQAPQRDREHAAFRMSVQYVIRADGHQINDYRGYAGRIDSGHLRVGQTITVFPSQQSAVVANILGPQGEQSEAQAGESISIALDRDIDVARGDLFAADELPTSQSQIAVDVCWLDTEPGLPGRRYWLRHGTRQVQARLDGIESRLNINTLSQEDAPSQLAANDLARVRLTLQKPLAIDPYDRLNATGALVLIDAATNHTAAAGLIRA